MIDSQMIEFSYQVTYLMLSSLMVTGLTFLIPDQKVEDPRVALADSFNGICVAGVGTTGKQPLHIARYVFNQFCEIGAANLTDMMEVQQELLDSYRE